MKNPLQKYIKFNFLIILLPLFLLLSLIISSNIEKLFVEENNSPETLSSKVESLAVEGKVNEPINLIKEAFNNNSIDIMGCHYQFHILGHLLYAEFPEKIEEFARQDRYLCGQGFHHGVEAEIVLRGGLVKEKLSEFCSAMRQYEPNIICYHGAGHAFIEQNRNVQKSLEKCDLLEHYKEEELGQCYRGVLSGYAFIIKGVNGDTGEPLPQGSSVKFEYSNPLDFCMTLGSKYRESCAVQLPWSVINAQNSELAFEKCLGNYPEKLKGLCIQNISAVVANGDFQRVRTVTVPDLILSLPKDIKEYYLEGIRGELVAFERSGLEMDWQSICNSFSKEDKSSCIAILSNH